MASPGQHSACLLTPYPPGRAWKVSEYGFLFGTVLALGIRGSQQVASCTGHVGAVSLLWLQSGAAGLAQGQPGW
jgi:hypothetical protein